MPILFLGIFISRKETMHIKSGLFAAVAVLCLGLIPVTQVRADSLDSFVYQIGGNTFTWELPASPTPDSANSGILFTLYDVSVSENDGPPILGTMTFYTLAYGGGLDFFVGDYYYSDIYGPQFYYNAETSPSFQTGTFTSLIDYGIYDDGVPGGTLQISTAVPEPSALLLLVIGLGLAFAICVVRNLPLCVR